MPVKTPQNRIGVKEAVQAARAAVQELLPASDLNDLQLEEVEQSEDEKYWLITLGFYERPTGIESQINPFAKGARKYKLFKVDAESGKVRAMKIRTV